MSIRKIGSAGNGTVAVVITIGKCRQILRVITEADYLSAVETLKPAA